MSSAFLDALGFTTADVNKLPEGIRDCAQWSTILRAIDDGRINNASNGIDGQAVNRDFDGYVGENVQKWNVNEATKDSPDWSRQVTVESQFDAVAPTRTTRAFHLLVGQDSYLPTWAKNELAATPTDILDILQHRITQVQAQFPSEPFYRMDVINEITNQATATSQAADRGWRTSANSFRTASLDAGALAGPLAGNSEKWIWDAFTLAKAAWPQTKLAWTDFNQEYNQPPDAGTFPILGPPHNVSPFLTDNSYAPNYHRYQRLLYEIWRGKAAGAPIDVIGYQFHLAPVAPPEFVQLAAQMHDWNRFGVLPAITEFNAINSGASGTKIPPHCGSAGDERLERYVAWYAYHFLKVMLDNSPLEEVTFWSVASNTDTAQTSTKEISNFPIRTATMLALANARNPIVRTLKRGCLMDLQWSIPPHMSNSGATLSFSSRRCAISVAGSLQVPWSFFNAPWMARPIANTHLILGAQFNLSAAVSDNTVILGYGVGNSGTPDNTVKVKVMNNFQVVLEVRVLGSVIESVILGTANTGLNRFAVRVNGNVVQGVLNGIAGQPVACSKLFGHQDTVYVLSNPAGDGTHANLSIPYFEIQHGPDYPSEADLVALGTVRTRSCSLGIYDGAQ